jgi:hypothetical protein
MAFKKSVYISGPRMGTNNYMHGIELVDLKKMSKKKGKKDARKKRS